MRIVREANLRKPFEVTEMFQENFMDWKSHLEEKYRLEKKDVGGNPWRLRKIYWLNFCWGEEVDAAIGQTVLHHHPGEVWTRKNLFQTEPWIKIKMHTGPTHNKPTQLYSNEIRLKARKIQDLKAMATKYIPAPQRDYYLTLQSSDEENSDELTTVYPWVLFSIECRKTKTKPN